SGSTVLVEETIAAGYDSFHLSMASGSAPAGELSFTQGGSGEKGAWNAGDFRSFITEIDSAIDAMARRVNDIGIAQSSLSVREVTLSQGISANQSAVSRIMDTDFAKEQSESVRLQILQQTATSALAQANMGPQSVLGFLG
ncbi:flagellin, partial [Balneolales bacterium ANBcel1]|nr:flagellin [Balneolales bacterium ANBcel1]